LIDRIHERTIFARMRVEGKRVRSGSLWCSVILDPSLPAPKVAYAIGKRSGSAVARNRIRRRLRPLLAANSSQLPRGYFLVGAASEVATMPTTTLNSEVAQLVQRVRKVAGNA
jgi:ribonuclease P protein component